MFRQAAFLMSPAKATVAVARSSPTPKKTVALTAALTVALRASSPKSIAKKGASNSCSKASPKKVTFNAAAATKAKSSMLKAAASATLSSTPKKRAASKSPTATAANRKKSPTSTSAASKKKVVALRKIRTQTAARISSPVPTAKIDEVDDTLIDFEAADTIMSFVESELLFPEVAEVAASAPRIVEELLLPGAVVPSSPTDAPAVDLMAVNLFADDDATTATATATALMVITPETPVLEISVAEPTQEKKAIEVVAEMVKPTTASFAAVPEHHNSAAPSAACSGGDSHTTAPNTPLLLPAFSASSNGAVYRAASFALFDSIMDIVGELIPQDQQPQEQVALLEEEEEEGKELLSATTTTTILPTLPASQPLIAESYPFATKE